MIFSWDHDWRSVCWPIALDAPPQVVHAGRSVHGLHGHERYLLRDLWCLHLYLYETVLRVGPHRLPIRPGYAGIIPPNVPIEYEYQERGQHLFVHFRCPNAHSSDPSVSIPAMQDLGEDFPRFSRELEEVIQDSALPSHRMQARIWDILGRLAARPNVSQTDLAPAHPAVARAVHRIEMLLSESFSLSELARECGVSESYLGRLFREAFGTTAVGYVRARRVQRAEHLLRHSTLPIKAVAAASGLPDLHFFNKTIRRALGQSPRALRANLDQTNSQSADEMVGLLHRSDGI
jgi:AraC family transcriptional regulator